MDKEKKFVPVYQNDPVNRLAYLTDGVFSGKRKGDFLDKGNNVRIDKWDMTFLFNPARLSLSGRTHQFLMLAIERFAEKVPIGASRETVRENLDIKLTFSGIAKEFSVSRNAAKKMAVSAASALQMTVIEARWENKEASMYQSVNIFQGFYVETDKVTREGFIRVTLGQQFAAILAGSYLMWYPRLLRRVPLQYHPNSNAFGVRLSAHWNMNYLKPNRGRISVKALLDSTQDIPKYEDLDKRYMQVGKRILQPFIRDIDVLVEYGVLSEWYFEQDGRTVPRERYREIAYADFINCTVVFNMSSGFPTEKARKADAEKNGTRKIA